MLIAELAAGWPLQPEKMLMPLLGLQAYEACCPGAPPHLCGCGSGSQRLLSTVPVGMLWERKDWQRLTLTHTLHSRTLTHHLCSLSCCPVHPLFPGAFHSRWLSVPRAWRWTLVRAEARRLHLLVPSNICKQSF